MKRLAALALVLLTLPGRAAALEAGPNFREEWRSVVVTLSGYAKGRNPRFLVLVQDGPELVVKGRRDAAWEEELDPEGRTFDQRLPVGTVFKAYVDAVDGMVFNGLYCGEYRFEMPLDQALAERKAADALAAKKRRQGIIDLPLPGPSGPFSLDPAEELKKAEAIKVAREHEERQRRTLYALDAMRAAGKRLFSIEDCKTQAEVDAARRNADRDKILTFAGIGIAALDTLPRPRPRFESPAAVTALAGVRNWLPMERGEKHGNRIEWVRALETTNYDILAIDVAVGGKDLLVASDIARLRYKNVGPRRLVFGILPMGVATDWRWYWQPGWRVGNPSALKAPIPGRPGAYVADLSDPAWKEVIGRYVSGLIDLGFDGVILGDMSPSWFEDQYPLRQ